MGRAKKTRLDSIGHTIDRAKTSHVTAPAGTNFNRLSFEKNKLYFTNDIYKKLHIKNN